MRNLCSNRTVLYLGCGGEYTKLHMWLNYIELNTYTNENWGNLNKTGRLPQCQ